MCSGDKSPFEHAYFRLYVFWQYISMYLWEVNAGKRKFFLARMIVLHEFFE